MDDIAGNCSNVVRACVTVRPNEDIDSALRRFSKQVDKAEIIEDFYNKTFYLKPCLAKREKRKKRKSYE